MAFSISQMKHFFRISLCNATHKYVKKEYEMYKYYIKTFLYENITSINTPMTVKPNRTHFSCHTIIIFHMTPLLSKQDKYATRSFAT